MSEVASPDPWALLRPATPARVGLGRSGSSLPTAELLALRAAHLQARQAVLADFDAQAIVADLAARGVPAVLAQTMAADRSDYLLHPARGRQLTASSRSDLAALRQERPWDVVLIISDGLSPEAAIHHGAEVATALLAGLPGNILAAPVVVAPRGRVGLVSDVGSAAGARLAVILLGERPGLSAIDGLSAYLEYDPRPGRTDADRNCISNIRPAGGLAPVEAGRRLAELVTASLERRLSGTGLKVELGGGPQSLGRSSIGT